MDLDSDVITEVEIQPEMQEVEIESLPVVAVDINGDDAIEIAVDDDVDLGDNVMLETQEEVVGFDGENLELDTQGILIEADPPGPSQNLVPNGVSSHQQPQQIRQEHQHQNQNQNNSKKLKRMSNGTSGGNSKKRREFDPLSSPLTVGNGQHNNNTGKVKKWEPKQVQIRTLEGEFSVIMWASGADEGNSY